MYTLIRSLSTRQFLAEQVPTLGVSLFVAEIAYKFHSFLLEAGAFLVTWYGLDFIYQRIAASISNKRTD